MIEWGTEHQPRKPRPPMRFYESGSMQVCRPCRDDLLVNADARLAVAAGHTMEEVTDMITRKSDFTALGSRPWAGNDPPDRYIQCDQCNGQWGPDA